MRLVRAFKQSVARRPRLQSALFVLTLIAVAVISHLQWFNPGSILTFGDWQYRPDQHVRQLIADWQAWVPFEGMGTVNILMSGFPFRGLAWSAITNLGLPYDIATKITMFIPVAIGGFLCAYALGMRLFKDRLVSFTAALFYGSTPYFLLVQAVHGPIAVIYAFLPLLVLALDVAIERNRLRDWIVLALGFCIGIFYEVRIMYIVSFILAVYCIGTVLIRKKRLLRYLPRIALAGLLIIAVNLFWLIPTKLAAGADINQTAEGRLFGNALFDLAQSFTVMRWNWTGAEMDRTFAAQPVPPYLWIVPIIAFLSVLVSRHIRRMLLFVLITLAGIFLTKQSAEPFSQAYAWLFAHFPGFGVFREASKFYVLVAFGYFGMIGYALLGLRERYRHTVWKPLYGLALAAIVTVGVLNLWPAVTGQLAGTFKDKDIPADYQKFATFIQSQPEFFRTYWLPRESWWGYYDRQHPRVRANDMLERDWQLLAGAKGGDIYEAARKNVEFMKQPFAQSLLSRSSVKYVVVPVRDTASDDDFFPSYGNDRQYFLDELDRLPYLQRIDIGTTELAVYENIAFEPYIGAAAEVYAITNTAYPAEQTAFVSTVTDNFITANLKVVDAQAIPIGTVDTLFELQGPRSTANDHLTTDAPVLAHNSFLRIGQKMQRYHYTVRQDTVSLQREAAGALLFDGQVIDPAQPAEALGSRPLTVSVDRPAYVAADENVIPLNTTAGTHEIGSTAGPVRILQAMAANSLKNPSFEQGTWGPVSECNGLPRALISMEVAPGAPADGSHALNLYAQRRYAACVSQKDIGLSPGTYIVQFAYQNQGGEQVGYRLTLNDSAQTAIEKRLPVVDGQWRQYTGLITIPEGVTRGTLTLKGYAGAEQDKGAVSSFDALQLVRVDDVLRADLPPERREDYYLRGTGTFTFDDPAIAKHNAIPNSSFEQGVWQPEVGDCHNYDEHPVIGMRIIGSASDGRQALRLEATRHIACTYQSGIPVRGNTPYAFGFDYRATNTRQLHYRLLFDDPAKTVIDTYVPVAVARSWQRYTTPVRAPLGAKTVTVRVEAIPNAYGRPQVAIDFDAFSLTQTPDVQGTYHVVTPAEQLLTQPRSVRFSNTAPTRKRVSVAGATTPFYLTMHEKYDTYWQLEIGGKALRDARHFQINGALNAWYIDPAALCAKPAAYCTKDADGGYSFDADIIFTPQRAFTAELAVSGTAFVAASGYVIYDLYAMHQRKRYARRYRTAAAR